MTMADEPKGFGNPGYPWNIDAVRLVQETGWPLEKCQDQIIVQWLQRGDVRPLSDLLMQGHVPAIEVRKFIAWMILDEDLVKNMPPEVARIVPYRLVVKRRSGAKGRHANPENEIRDRLIAAQVHSRITTQGLSETDAISQVMKLGEEVGAKVGFQTIKRAYKRHRNH
jgi:hypothetical protein